MTVNDFMELEKKYNELVDKYNILADRYNGQARCLARKIREFHQSLVENEQLKKNAIVWHKQDIDDIYNAFKDWSVHKYLCKMKDGYLNIAVGSIDEDCDGNVSRNIYFEINDEKYCTDDVEAWAELPSVEAEE